MSHDMMYIETIFAPTSYQFERHIRSTKSFVQYYKNYNYSFPVVFSGYCPNDNHYNQIKEELDKIGATCHREGRNVGKSKILNYWIRQNLDKHSFFWHSDHDIIFDINEVHLYERLLESFKHHKEHPIGIVSLNQKEVNAHILSVLTASIKYDGAYVAKEELLWNPIIAGGIGGGSWAISKECFLATTGYREFDVYGGVDGWMHADAVTKGFNVVMHRTASIIHPHETDERYKQWKKDTNNALNKGHLTGSLEDRIHHADNFWRGA
jgi:hypothetical protein